MVIWDESRPPKGLTTNVCVMGLQRIERGIERLVEGLFAKTFRSSLEPVEISRRLTREMDLRRTVGVSGMVAPNRFIVTIGEEDAKRFSDVFDALTRDFVEALRDHSRAERYGFMGPIRVDIKTEPSLKPGFFEVTAMMTSQSADGPLGAVILPDGRRVEIGIDPIFIGRLPSCEVSLADPNVSRRHAKIHRHGNVFIVTDLGSTNGTRVNGTRVTGERRLYHGDEVGVGSTSLSFEGA